MYQGKNYFYAMIEIILQVHIDLYESYTSINITKNHTWLFTDIFYLS